jgi:hypothetical protein
MTQPRLTSEFWLSSLRRRIEADGGTLMVLNKGDAVAGAVLLIERRRDGRQRLFDAANQLDGSRAWTLLAGGDAVDDAAARELITRARRRDPDLWVAEAEIASLEPYLDGPLLGQRSG